MSGTRRGRRQGWENRKRERQGWERKIERDKSGRERDRDGRER